MAEEIKITLLAIIQGVTEFLPVSSSGHIVLFDHLFGSMDNDIVLEVILHFGTLISILYFFRKDIVNLIKGVLRADEGSRIYVFKIIVATFPAVIFVLLLKLMNFEIESLFTLNTLVYTYLLNSVILFATKNYVGKNDNISYSLAIAMGLAQVFALLPGVSRAGITICTALILGYNQKIAAKFSFFMAIPAMLGALVFKFEDIFNQTSLEMHSLVIGFSLSMLTGLLVLKLLFRILEGRKLWIFAFYSMLVWLTIILNSM